MSKHRRMLSQKSAMSYTLDPLAVISRSSRMIWSAC